MSGRIFDGAGTATTDEFVVNEERQGSQFDGDVAVLSDGRILVTWTSNSSGSAGDGSGSGVFGQILAADGRRIDGEFLINTETSSSQLGSSIAVLPGGNFVVAWESFSNGITGDGSNDGVFLQVFGDPAGFFPSDAPVLQGVPEAVTLGEAAVNAGLVLIDPDKTIALGDSAPASFDGATLTVRADAIVDLDEQFLPPDDNSQDTLGLIPGDNGNGAVTLSGSDVLVDGILVGTITSDGLAGNPLTITFNASASVESVEAVLGQLGYSNASDDPVAARRLSLDVSDGDGHHARTAFVDLTIEPEQDGIGPAQDETRVNAHRDNIQSDPQIVELTGGGFVVVWTSTNQDERGSNDTGVFGQIYAADGAPIGQEFQVNTDDGTLAAGAGGDGHRRRRLCRRVGGRWSGRSEHQRPGNHRPALRRERHAPRQRDCRERTTATPGPLTTSSKARLPRR